LGYAAVPPAGVILDFVRSLERLLAEQADPVTLETLGPLTSLALALRSDPDLVRAKVARHIAMVGTLEAKGNTTPLSEFNAWCDPEALQTVLRAELPTELVGLDVTRQLVLDAADVERLGRSGVPLAQWLHEALRFYVEFHRQQEGLEGCIVNDVLPIAALLEPETVTFKPLRLAVDLADDERRGRTRVAPDGVQVLVATEVNIPPIRALLSKRVFRRAATPPAADEPHAPTVEARA
jgi:purine nucleosidase